MTLNLFTRRRDTTRRREWKQFWPEEKSLVTSARRVQELVNLDDIELVHKKKRHDK